MHQGELSPLVPNSELKERKQILLAEVQVFADSSETWKLWTDLQTLKNGLSTESHIAGFPLTN